MTTPTTAPLRRRWRLTLPAFAALMAALLILALLALQGPAPARAAILGVAAGAVVLALAWRWPFAFLGLLLALVPLYDGLVRYLTYVLAWSPGLIRSLSLWKEGGLLLLFAILLIQHLTGRRRIVWRLYAFDLWLAALLALSLLYIIVAARPGIGVYGLRNYLVPLALFFLARLMVYSRRDLKRLIVALLVVGAGVAAFGVYQARVLDFPAMIALGFVDDTGAIPQSFRTALRDGFPIPRAVSTTTGPNQFAVYLNVLILTCLFAIVYLRKTGQRIVLAGLAVLYLAALTLTLSRGGLLMLIVSLLAWGALLVEHHGVRRTWRELTQNPLLLAGLTALVIVGVAGVFASGTATRILRGLTGRDPSADAHQSSMQYSLGFIAENPLGIGMGMVGERALQFAAEANVEHTESTILQVGMEMGVFGMALLLAVLASLVLTLWRMSQRARVGRDPIGQTLAELALVLWIGAMADFIFTPLLQNVLAAGYLWWIAGVAFHEDAYASPSLANGVPGSGAVASEHGR